MTRLDEQLVAGYLAGNDRCFALLIERYQEPLMRFLRSRLVDDGLAEDALQEVFLTAALTLESLVNPERFRSWIYTIANRKGAVMRTRRAREPRSIPFGGVAAVDPATAVEPPASHEPALRERFRKVIARLKGEDRAMLDLRILDGFSHAEIAEILGGSAASVRTRIWRLKRRILEWLGGPESEPV